MQHSSRRNYLQEPLAEVGYAGAAAAAHNVPQTRRPRRRLHLAAHTLDKQRLPYLQNTPDNVSDRLSDAHLPQADVAAGGGEHGGLWLKL
jgi:hypothetical protein